MGKRIPSAAAAATTANLRDFARLAAGRLGKARPCQASLNSASSPKAIVRCRAGGADPSIAGRVAMEEDPERRGERLPLSEVVADCVKRWFQDTLKEAKAGDIAMQVLVGQMYYNGYGINRNVQKGKAWISRASRHRPSALKVADKCPGYNVSDSDSDELSGVAR
ncbi:unnamed protein product [Spirodela intermedia]|uniref:Uncharacterized protein n=2 Tax=Spirodela intermedia TaxID=51605 RepID=A0A7I8K633_SPIIN|nr:unnamed protein product [Spirodela intermedia]CAA6656922.1 unnamed protein product [Spirodela intermedia]CAA7392877.1 unnamed protein product [Spirodela intermedia]